MHENLQFVYFECGNHTLVYVKAYKMSIVICFSLVANHDLTPSEIETILDRLNNEQSEQQFIFEVMGDEVGKAIFFKK